MVEDITPGVSIPIILIAFIAGFLMYIMWVNPSERLCFLGFCDSEGGIPIEGKDSVGIASFDVGFIGGTSGEFLSSKIFEDITVSQLPIDEELFSDSEFTLNSNFLVSGNKKYDVNNFNNASDYLYIKFRMASSKGNPSLRVVVNGVIYEDTLLNNEMEVIIPPTELRENNKVKIVCQYHGLSFWNTQSCEVRDVAIAKRDYLVEDSAFEETFDISGAEEFAEKAVVTFVITNSNSKGALEVKLNGNTLYRGNPETGEIVQIKENSDFLTSNRLVFSSEKEGSYEISRFNLTLATGILEPEIKIFSFSVAPSNLNKQATIFAEVKRTIVSGTIAFTLYPEFTTYETRGVPEGFEGWISIPTSVEGLEEEENTIRIQSPSGRFEIGTMKIVLEQ